MKVGLWSDAVNFPSLPLMKLSAYYKERGHATKLIDNFLEKFDVAYCSKTFNLPMIKKIPQLPHIPLADEIHFSGTGFATETVGGKEQYVPSKDLPLPHDIEHIYPDYGLYPELTRDTAFGFLTRGCPNHCGFCLVSKKEGVQSIQVSDLQAFWRGQRYIKLMDANLLASKNAVDLIIQLIQSNAVIDVTQGFDARYVDEDMARLISAINIKMIHFAFDLIRNEAEIVRGLRLFRKHFKKSDRFCKIYILTNYNTTHAEDWYRVRKVIELGFQPDIRIYQKGTHSQFLTDLSRWVNSSRIYRSCSFEDYLPRKDGKSCNELYRAILHSN